MMISIEAAEKQLSPLEELIAIHGKFISLREMVEQIKRRYPSMTCGQVALWLVNKLEGLDDYHRRDFQVEKLMRGHKHDLLKGVAKHGAEVMNNNNQFDEICVRREDAEGKLNIEFPVMAEFLPPVLTVNDCTYQDDEYHHADNSVSDINNDISPPAVWENTHGMETANKLIAGLAIANAINDKRCQRKDGLNKSAVARVAENALLKYGGSIGVSDRQLTALISEALKCAPKLKDYTDSEQP
ncbi:hypothetical protein FHE25_22220 [Salmonella enterica]|uniref:hypothetical protein n=1 Tax=Salmonella enterica TaxID=28901 RepID=UPI0011318944|nr:hypothetical protein [Salmonella enterica]EAV1937094.1 hypothetical protein [Salmonella enterica]EBB7504502.1 hypothetical protein [Salmonella enterica]EDU0714750.1 hypothetical protein [Salmonella enterica]EFO8357739.1 hypothetical protein [Salmonella enterica]EHA6077977.1 hypothetical protein [Salmonella enterica]